MKKLKGILIALAVIVVLSMCSDTQDPADNPTPDTTAAVSEETVSLNTPEMTGSETAYTTVPETGDGTVPDTTAEVTEGTLPADSYFEVHYLDVGQADAALVLCDGEALLIDGGNSEDSSLIYAYLKNHGIDHLDGIVASHGHEDHCGGLSGALNYATADIAYAPVDSFDTKAFSNFVKYLDKQDLDITIPSHGDTFTLGSAEGTFLGPIYDSDEPNNTSLVIRLDYGETSFLFTGDAELEEETNILDAGYDISCTVLKVAHHGSESSTGYRWLRESAPEYAVISVGTDNSYGHPTEATLSRLRDAEVKVYRTDMQGHIICRSNGTNVTFSVEKNADADTLSNPGAIGNHGSKPTEPKATEPKATEPAATEKQEEGREYVLNTNTKKFHYPSCSSVDSMKEKNKKVVVDTREHIIDMGYEPCGRCHP